MKQKDMPLIVWLQSMNAKLVHQELLKQEAEKVALYRDYEPRIKIGKKNKALFENYVKNAGQAPYKKNNKKNKK